MYACLYVSVHAYTYTFTYTYTVAHAYIYVTGHTGMLDELVGSHTKVAIYPAYTCTAKG